MIRSPGSAEENGPEDDLFGLFEASAKLLAKSADAPAFLDWIARHGPDLAPEFARGIDPRTGPPGLAFRAMGIAIYNAMPLPEAGFQIRRLAVPGRNQPCLCGSGRKYKHCCLRLHGTLDLSGYSKRTRLIATVLVRGERGLRVAALERRSTILADRGDLEAAWQSFRDAQREDPEDPNLATLELTLLVSRGEIEQARERARFWISRLERKRDPELAGFIGFLRRIHADPHAAMAEGDAKRFPGLDRLGALLAAAPAPQAQYTAADRGESGWVLEPLAALAAFESRWRKVFPQTKPGLIATQHGFEGMWNTPARWLDFLERHALAWQSFDVLDDLAMAVDVLQPMGAGATILEPLLERGAALLELNLAAAAGGATLQWGWPENRPALRMLAHLAYRAAAAMDRSASHERFVGVAERLLALNPGDNHFVREPLTRAYLARGWPEKVVALTERYPDDFCGPALNRILALVSLERRGEALVALRAAAQEHRVAIEMLLAAAPKQPKPDAGPGITMGGKQEAWEYREAHHALWQRDGALDWLRAAWSEVRKAPRP